MPEFIPGLRLSELFFRDAVRPIIAKHWPALRYSAGLLQTGSDVLGFDTPLSRDHGWGPRCMLFLEDADHAALAAQVTRSLADELPLGFLGYSTHFVRHVSPIMTAIEHHPITHWAEVTTIARFFVDYLGVDARHGLTEIEWLTLPSQKLRTIRSGRVHHDGLEQLEVCRRTLDWYAHDLWLHLMACQWQRINQEEPFVARSGDVGDELGSRIIATRLIEDVTKLCFLIEREYPPYAKWFGTAFARLRCAAELTPVFDRALTAANWRERERAMSAAYLALQRLHNELGVTPPIEPRVAPFHNRPYQVPHAGRFVDALHAAIASESVKSLPKHLGAIWQFTDSTDVLENVSHCRRLMGLAEHV